MNINSNQMSVVINLYHIAKVLSTQSAKLVYSAFKNVTSRTRIANALIHYIITIEILILILFLMINLFLGKNHANNCK